MTIATEKIKPSSERFILARLEPARYVLPTLISGSDYGVTFPYVVSRIQRNGVDISKVTSLSGNDQYTYNEDTGAVVVRLASAPNATTNVIVVFYYLFYTATLGRAAKETPTDSGSALRLWSPKIQKYPSFLQSYSNLLEGVFSLDNSNLVLINTDKDFQNYLTADDSFYNKKAEMWLCLNGLDSIQKVFSGKVASLSLDLSTVKLNLLDTFNGLKQTALMGDQESESLFTVATYPDLHTRYVNKPIPFMLGVNSYFKTNRVTTLTSTPFYTLDDGTEAVCTSYDGDKSVTTNREWGLCRTSSAIPTQSFGTFVRESGGSVIRAIKFTTIQNVNIGDTFKWYDSGGGVDAWAIVLYVGDFTYLGDSYNLAIYSPVGTISYTGTDTITPLPSIGILVDTGSGLLPSTPEVTKYYPRYDVDYTLTSTATSGGNYYHKITFADNFEDTVFSSGAVSPLDPDRVKVLFRVAQPSTDYQHGDVVRLLLEKSGFSVPDATTFDAASSLLPVNVRFQIPNIDEDKIGTYLQYLQDILASTIGYLSINDDSEIEYYLVNPGASSGSRNKYTMLSGATGIKIDYQDITTQLIGYNPHNDSGFAVDGVDTPVASAISKKAEYLHSVVNVNRFKHCLEEISSRIQSHIELKSNRRATYSYETATEDTDSNLGDTITIENAIIPGSTVDVKLVTIDKSPKSTNIEAIDLLGLTEL